MIKVLINPLANNKTGEAAARAALKNLVDDDTPFIDVTTIDVGELIAGLGEDDRVILTGGDGTLNRFVNALNSKPLCRIDYIPTGSGNDFKEDVGMSGDFIHLNEYINDLPRVTVNGKEYSFINGVGYGIDGYCCEVGDELKEKSDKPVNYAGIAVKGLLFHFKPRNCTVVVDGVEHSFKKTWLAPTMFGRFYGGGMKVAPDQARFGEDGKAAKTLTLVVWHGTGKLRTLIRFPKIFKGEHVKYEKMVDIFTGKEITVKFDKPTALQIDGETVKGVTEYTAKVRG